MKYLKAMYIAAFAISLLFLTACGGGDDKKKEVKLILTPGTVPVVIGQPAIFTVGTTNTDYSVSTDKAAAGCVKTNATTVTCTPTAADTYTLTITATADSKVTATATITVSELSVSIDISSTSETVLVGQSTSFTITTKNTDFEISTSPATGAGCVKVNSTLVTCTPTAAGTYTLTVTPTASGKADTKTATLVVEPKPANIEITNKPTGSVDTWSPITLNVTRADTPAFTVEITSSNPGDGISCDTPTADSVICTPIKAGTYEVTIKASTDNTKTDSVTITAIEPDVLSVGGAESEYKISMVRVEKTGDGGEDDQGFLMGCTRNEGGYTSTNCANNARYEHTVQLTQDYYIGKYEVTLKQWKQVAHSVPENAVTEFDGSPNDNLPVTWVSYQDVGKFIDGLNNIGEYATTDYAVPGMKWALPTEAQWEYAARGGNKPTNCPNAPNADKWGCLYSGSSWFGNVAWQQTNSNGTIHPVGTVVPPEAPDAPADSSNELGVFDMSGNVSEWVYDWLTRHTTEPRKDYSGPEAGNSHVFRGGSFEQSYVYTTVAWRGPANDFGDYADGTKGFRLALVPDPDYIPGSDK